VKNNAIYGLNIYSHAHSYGKKVQREYGEGEILKGVGSGILK
jgi:hypothetical protein